MKHTLRIIILAVMLGGITFFEIVRTPHKVIAIESKTVVNILPSVTPTPTLTPTPVPQYSMGKYAGNEYAEYIWAKWAPHGNRSQAVALCTNISEGHLDDNATNVNVNNEGTDRGCWMWNDKYHPDVSDEVARDCIKATDLTYNVWLKRIGMGITDGFQGMWYGYGSKNYNLCIASL